MDKFLKTIFFTLLVLVLPLGLASCGGDDDDEPANPGGGNTTSIYGTWHSSEVEKDDDVTVTTSFTLVFNENGTGSLTATRTTSRASSSLTLREQFSWSLNKDSDNVEYISFIHTGGDEIFGTDRYYVTLAGGALSIGQLVFTR